MKIISFLMLLLMTTTAYAKDFVYIASDTSIPFWKIVAKGVSNRVVENGDNITILNSNNSNKNEIINSVKSIRNDVDGVILSPCTSKSAKTTLTLFENKGIPVVVADIGSVSDNYLTYISSDNKKGSYELGKYLATEMISKGIENKTVGIIAIPQKRANGIARTTGFMDALNEYNVKTSNLFQQVTFSKKETYDFAKKMIKEDENLGAIWLQGSDKYMDVMDAIKESKRDILILTFDAETEFMSMIKERKILASVMQQPYNIGKKSVDVLYKHLNGESIKKEIKIDTIVVSPNNIDKNRSFINKNVFGIE